MTAFILPDLLSKRLKIVFCGCAASKESARLMQYYAGPGNKFWQILFQTGLTDRLLQPSTYKTMLTYGLGLTDIAKLSFGNDINLREQDFDRVSLLDKIKKYQPNILCFNGKRSATKFLERKTDYGLQPERVGKTRLFIAPSTSGSACRFWDSKLWHDLADLCK